MEPLEYRNIGGEEHLTFDSIRRLVLHQLSELSVREAKKHIDGCTRCSGIEQSLATPEEIRQSNSHNFVIRPLLLGLLLVILVIGTAASILYFGSESRAPEEKKAEISGPSDIDALATPELTPDEEAAAPVIEAIDTLAQIHEEPELEPALPTNKQFDQYIEKEQSQPRIKLRGIYGKITADGQPLPGVTVKVPGSRTGRVTDEGGKYYIQVPRNAKSLIFIYRGKQLTKELDPSRRRYDIYLKSESLSHPEPQSADAPANVES